VRRNEGVREADQAEMEWITCSIVLRSDLPPKRALSVLINKADGNYS